MKNKVGQWVRDLENNKFSKITRVFQIDEKIFYFAFNNFEIQINDAKIETYLRVADTPQELIEVGDLYEFEGQVIQVGNGYFQFELKSLKNYIITKIWTPNSSGGYDLQWTKE